MKKTALNKLINNYAGDESKETKFINEFTTISEILALEQTMQDISECANELTNNLKSKPLKSCSESQKQREEGNRLFKAHKKGNALAASRFYTNAIFAAPEGSVELAFAHGNRAAALYEFGYYLEAHSDCCLALSLGYPEEKKDKIVIRQAHCSVKLEDYSLLNEALETIKNMPHSTSSIKEIKEFEKQLKILRNKTPKQRPDEPCDYKVQNIIQHPKKGRCMTAFEDHQKDELILSEKAWSMVPVQNAKICYNCGNDQIIPFPCYTCSKAIYCSLKCKEAHKRIHDYECYGYKCDLYDALGITHLALNTLITGLPQIMHDLKDCASAEQIWETIEIISKSGKKGYPDILALFVNINGNTSKDIRSIALSAIVAAHYLIHFTLFLETFNENQTCTPSDWLLVLSALILRHAAQTEKNAQASISIVFVDKSYDYLALSGIWQKPQHLKRRFLHRFRDIDATFAGLYPYLSLCNHSCEPSLRLHYSGRYIIGKCRRDMRRGEEIFNSYILDCRNNSIANRKMELESAYRFQCDCKHCSPESKDEEYLKFHKYRCCNKDCNQIFSLPPNQIRWWVEDPRTNNCLLKCTVCNTAHNLNWYINFDDMFTGKILTFQALMTTFELFKYSATIVHGYSDLRQHMAWLIVTSFFDMWEGNIVSDELYSNIAEILKYLMDHVEEQNDVESVLYASTSTFAIELMADGKYYNFDTKKIRRSFDVLSDELKTVFENYINDYVEELFDD